MLGWGEEREVNKLQEMAWSVGNSHSITARLWILMTGTLPPPSYFVHYLGPIFHINLKYITSDP